MSNAITLYDETEKVASAMVKSGYFQDSKDVSQAIVKILAGREMGFGAFASMTGVYIIQGRPSVGANLMASAVKRSGRYDYRVMEMTDTACEIEYLQGGKSIGRSRFTIEDAKKAQTKNLDKFPRNMLFARAMSNGVRWYCPDVFDGAPVYTPEELGADVTESGDVVPGSFVEVKAAPAPVQAHAQKAQATPVPQVAKWEKAGPDIGDGDNMPMQALEEPVHVTYTGSLAKIGKDHAFPALWGQALMPKLNELGGNAYHLGGILWKLNIPQETTPARVVEMVKEYLAQQ